MASSRVAASFFRRRSISPILRNASRAVAVTGTFTISLATAGALYHRPQPDFTSGSWGGPKHYAHKTVTEEQKLLREWFTAFPLASAGASTLGEENEAGPSNAVSYVKIILSDAAAQLLLVGYEISQHIALAACNLVINIGMSLYNTHEVVRDDRYHKLIECVRRTNIKKSVHSRNDPAPNDKAPSKTALLTVSNHSSTIDDPVIFGLLLPDDIKYRPEKLRWGMCSQEICFKHAAAASILGAGKILPIRRGGGIDQILLETLASKLWAGSWVHVFPEGKVCQSGNLGANYFGTRPDRTASKIGKLKWGVGKMVAHAHQTELHVVPIHHVGMEGIVPQKPTGETLQPYPVGNNHVKVRVGKRVLFDDLILEHESKHGALTKYPSNGYSGRWTSTKSEMTLYSRIARRIEDALMDLEQESRSDPCHNVQKAYGRLAVKDGL